MSRIKHYDYGIVRMDDSGYPAQLLNIPDPPAQLYYIGDLSILSGPLVSIVGTRRASSYGKWAAREISKSLAACGVAVVSGMAEGIDTAAHFGCLEAGAPTVAVLGTGIDIVFPASNEKLYDRIAREGLIISELQPGYEGRGFTFPKRNRIISGLSEKLIVVEGTMKSGSMISARHAIEQGRDVFAVPGNINQPGSLGVNRLIADGAYPILGIDSVPELLGFGKNIIRKRIEGLSDEEKLVFAAIIKSPGEGTEYVIYETGLLPSAASSYITGLELKGLIYTEGSRLYPCTQ